MKCNSVIALTGLSNSHTTGAACIGKPMPYTLHGTDDSGFDAAYQPEKTLE